MVAIHNRALTQAQIQQNFDAGVGEHFFLLFSSRTSSTCRRATCCSRSASSTATATCSTSRRSSTSTRPPRPDQFRSSGMRIGVNGAEAPRRPGLRDPGHDRHGRGLRQPARAIRCPSIGTVVALDKGPAADQFFLSFELLGTQTNVRTEPAPTPPPPPPDGDPAPDIGVRMFDEINATMSQHHRRADDQRRRSATPTRGSGSSCRRSRTSRASCPRTRSASAQLAIEYCNALVEDTALRAAYFPGFNFGAPAATAFDTPAERDLIIGPADVARGQHGHDDPAVGRRGQGELDALIDRLTACGGGCAADRTEVVVKAACAGADRQRQDAAAMRYLQPMTRKSQVAGRSIRTSRCGIRTTRGR